MNITDEHLTNLGFKLGTKYWVYSKHYTKGNNQIRIDVRIAHANNQWIMMIYGENAVKGAEIFSIEDIAEILSLFPEFRSTSIKVRTYIDTHK